MALATSNYILAKGYLAESALVKFRGVKGGTDEQAVTAITTAGAGGKGVAIFDVTTAEINRGKGASVMHEGRVEAEAGAAISKEALVTVDNVGRFVTATTGDHVWGRAEQAASASGKVFTLQLQPIHTVL